MSNFVTFLDFVAGSVASTSAFVSVSYLFSFFALKDVITRTSTLDLHKDAHSHPSLTSYPFFNPLFCLFLTLIPINT